MTTSSGRPSPVTSMPPTLVEQLADALGAAEARCAERRINIQPVTCQPSLRSVAPYNPPSYINAESAPFLVQPRPFELGSFGALAQAPAMLPPPLPIQPHIVDGFSPSCQTGPASYEQGDHRDDHWADPDHHHDDAADLPRFFALDREVPPHHSLSHAAASQKLSTATMAFGFLIGLALILPTMWLSDVGKVSIIAKRAAPSGNLTMPLMTASSVAPLVPAAAFEVAERGGRPPTEVERLELAEAAFLEASRRIAAGDYIGARDQLRRAITFGENRAQELLDALP
jgi:hypothetical protein